jgi:hypothetical protein
MRALSSNVMLALVAACLLPGAALAGKNIYRCDVGGRISYSDQGCTGESEAVVVAMLPASTDTPNVHTPTSSVQGDRTNGLPIVPGMSPRAVLETLGRPVETIATLQGRMLIEYWLYRGTSGIGRVAFQDGRVTRVDTR